MIAATTLQRTLVCVIGITTALAQSPSFQDRQNKFLQDEESTQKTIAELKAEIAVLQHDQKPPTPVPSSSAAAPQTSEIPVVHSPVEYYGTETRHGETAGENEVGAPRIDNEPLSPELRGFFSPSRDKYLHEVWRLRKKQIFFVT